MKAVISQPTYLPWSGYFDLIDQSDVFIFLDSVQFDKRSWQQRNRIKGPNGLILLTVPVNVKGRFEQRLLDAAISDPGQGQKHCRAIEMNYRHARHFQKYWPELSAVIRRGWETGRLCELNIAVIRWCMTQLEIERPVLRSSEISCEGRRGEFLAHICENVGADEYISALGSATYLLGEAQQFEERDIDVTFQHFVHPEYDQLFPPFVPFASVIDLIFNVGERAMNIVRSGRRDSFTIERLRHQCTATTLDSA